MKSQRSSLFRPDALRRYGQSQEKTVLPQLVGPRAFVGLWILLATLLTAGVVVGASARAVLLAPTASLEKR
jgi:hypothetical protein